MLHEHLLGLDKVDTVTLVVAVIGVMVPLAYTVFVYYLTRRSWASGKGERSATAEYLRELQLRHAAEQIKRRQRTGSISGEG